MKITLAILAIMLLVVSVAFGQAKPAPKKTPKTPPKTVPTTTPKAATLAPGVVAVVNGEQITKDKVMQQLWDTQGKKLLSEMIDQTLIAQEVKKKGIVVTEADISGEMEQLKGMLGPDADLNQMLAMQGMTMDQLREQMKLKIALDKLVVQGIQVAESDLDGVSAKQITIIVGTDEGAEAKAKAAADAARTRIVGGESFDAVAKELSADPRASEPPPATPDASGTPQNGIDMGIVRKGQVDPDTEKALFALPVNEVSQPIRTTMGFQLFLVTEKITASSLSADEKKKLIDQRRTELARQELPRWFQDLKSKATVKSVFPDLDAVPGEAPPPTPTPGMTSPDNGAPPPPPTTPTPHDDAPPPPDKPTPHDDAPPPPDH